MMWGGKEECGVHALRSALLRPPNISWPPAARSAAWAKFATSATLFMSFPSTPRSYTCIANVFDDQNTAITFAYESFQRNPQQLMHKASMALPSHPRRNSYVNLLAQSSTWMEEFSLRVYRMFRSVSAVISRMGLGFANRPVQKDGYSELQPLLASLCMRHNSHYWETLCICKIVMRLFASSCHMRSAVLAARSSISVLLRPQAR